MRRLVVALFIYFFVSIGETYATVVEIWPGFYTIDGRKSLVESIKKYNFASYAITKSGEIVLLPNDISKKYVGVNLLNLASIYFLEDVEEYKKEIERINQRYNDLKDIFDPVAWAFKLMAKVISDGDKKKEEEFVQSVGGVYWFKEMVNGVLGTVVDDVIKVVSSGGKIDKNEIKKQIAEWIAKEYFTKFYAGIGVEVLKAKLLENEGWQYFLEKMTSLIIDFSLIAAENRGTIFKGFWNKLSLWLEIGNGIWNIGNLINAIYSTIDRQEDMAVKQYAYMFIKDYIYEFDFDIDRMAAYIKEKGLSQEYKVLQNHTPSNFFELFVLYGISKGYISKDVVPDQFFWIDYEFYNINLYDNKTLLRLWNAAQDVLFLIRNFGDGGNYKIYLDIDQQNHTIRIHPKSYELNPLYWMISRKLSKQDVNILFPIREQITAVSLLKDTQEEMRRLFQPGISLESKIFFAQRFKFIDYNYFFVKANPFFQYSLIQESLKRYRKVQEQKYKEFIKRLTQGKTSVLYGQGLNLDINKPDYTNMLIGELQRRVDNLIKINLRKKKSGKFVEIGVTKEIRYRNLSYENNYIIDYDNVVLCMGVDNEILQDLWKKGYVSDCSLMSGNAFAMPVEYQTLKEILRRFVFLNSGKIRGLSRAKLERVLRAMQWQSPITRKQFFQFLVSLLDIKIYPTYYVAIHSPLSQCYKSTVEGCALVHYGVSNGKYPDAPLTLGQVLLFLDKIEKSPFFKSER